MKKSLLRYLGAAALALGLIGSAQAVPLSDLLLAGGSITAGDKLFDEWTVNFYDASDGRTFNPDNILVTSLDDGGDNPGPGLSFAVDAGELTINGDDIYAYIDLKFGFRASVLPGAGKLIKDNSLALTQGSVTAFGDNGFYIHETIGTAPGLDDLGDKDVEFSFLQFDENGDPGPGLISNTSDSAEFAPQSEIWVTKNILVWATGADEAADLKGFEQRFSQQAVPEPATLALLSLGLVGLGFARRRRS